jgi:hypothetical protein
MRHHPAEHHGHLRGSPSWCGVQVWVNNEVRELLTVSKLQPTPSESPTYNQALHRGGSHAQH